MVITSLSNKAFSGQRNSNWDPLKGITICFLNSVWLRQANAEGKCSPISGIKLTVQSCSGCPNEDSGWVGCVAGQRFLPGRFACESSLLLSRRGEVVARLAQCQSGAPASVIMATLPLPLLWVAVTPLQWGQVSTSAPQHHLLPDERLPKGVR